MAPPVIITFLGTSSATPSLTRNHSSLAITLPTLGNSTGSSNAPPSSASTATYLFDAGEATQNQLQKVQGGFKPSSIRKIFITHMHGDHMFGVVPLLCTLMNGAGGTVGAEDPRLAAAEELNDSAEGEDAVEKKARMSADIEFYGPEGLREYIRASLRLTRSMLGGVYVVHELHGFPEDGSTAVSASSEVSTETGKPGRRERDPSIDSLGLMELPGWNIYPDSKGYWHDIVTSTRPLSRTEDEFSNEWTVSAGPIKHSVPCVGYVLNEPPLPGKITPEHTSKVLANKAALIASGLKNPMSLLSKLSTLAEGESIPLPDGDQLTKPPERRGRKITVLGDTCDPSGVAHLAEQTDVLIHEATNSYLSEKVPQEMNRDFKEGETYEDVKTKTIDHGHSTPEMAAEFAVQIKLGEAGGIFGRIIGSGSDEATGGKPGKAGKKKGKEEAAGRGLLLLNHFSSRYADPRSSEPARIVMDGIRSCAVDQLSEYRKRGTETDVVCAYDLMQYEIRAGD